GMANNLDMVLDAAKELEVQHANDIHFIFLGDGVHKQELEKRQREENIGNVSFLSSIKKEHIPNFLKKADVGLLPLHDSPVFNWGISPNKMYDYMAAKLPVVIATDIDQDALHPENPSILIRENQAENLVKLLSELQLDRQKAKE
ncbi:glycosyltransferase, partial [Microvirga sp. 3-52]|nr:glycosyltransferase [Microvirga sp. 3-52]